MYGTTVSDNPTVDADSADSADTNSKTKMKIPMRN